jgi:hypothetical protein
MRKVRNESTSAVRHPNRNDGRVLPLDHADANVRISMSFAQSGTAAPGSGQTRLEVDGFLAGSLQRVLHADARRLWRIDPPGEGRQRFSKRNLD